MSRTMWILLGLLAILSIGTIWRQESECQPRSIKCAKVIFPSNNWGMHTAF